VEATGFLPGVISFLCALSHLERVAHRLSNLFFQFNHLSLLERVLNKLANKPHAVKHCMATIADRKIDTGFPTCSTMVNGLTDMASNKTPRIGSILRQRMFWLFRINTEASRSVDVWGISCRGQTGCLVHKIRKNQEEPLSRIILAIYSHGPGLTLVTLGTACVQSACIPFARFPLTGNLG
jgi:hypothetical protein